MKNAILIKNYRGGPLLNSKSVFPTIDSQSQAGGSKWNRRLTNRCNNYPIFSKHPVKHKEMRYFNEISEQMSQNE